MKYQIGEVVRFKDDTPQRGGCLATITNTKQYGNYGDGTLAPGPVYKTAITGDTWWHEDYFVPVNGGMKHVEESVSESPLPGEQSFMNFVRTLNDEDLESLHTAVEVESRCRDEQQQRKLAGAIVSVMEEYLLKFGDDRDFYCTGYGDIITMQMMHDAIVSEFDLTAQ